MTPLQFAEDLGLPPLETEEVGGPSHVDVEERTPHQEIRGLGRHVLGELGQPLRGDDPGEAALATAAHQVRHRTERELARLFRDIARDSRSEKLRLVDHDEGGEPMVAVGIEQRVEEGCGSPHLQFGVEALERQHGRNAMLAHADRDRLEFRHAAITVDHHMAEAVGQADEIPFRIDHDLLDVRRTLFEQASQQVRLARSRVALDQEARRQEFFEVDDGGPRNRPRRGGRAHVDVDLHRHVIAEAGLMRQGRSSAVPIELERRSPGA